MKYRQLIVSCRRLEKEKEKQELIRQGLLEPPKPKVKLSTFHRSLGVEASMDPTAVEAQVRADQDARQQVSLFSARSYSKLGYWVQSALGDKSVSSDCRLPIHSCLIILPSEEPAAMPQADRKTPTSMRILDRDLYTSSS